MSARLRFRIFAHSWLSDWNHGNAHFLRGLARELISAGHEVRCYEEEGGWSLSNLQREEKDCAGRAIEQFRGLFPQLDVRFYKNDSSLREFAARELRGADIVLVHEWTSVDVANTILSLKNELGFRALFHDTHHRAYTSAAEILKINLRQFDGVLAFGEAIRRIYKDGFGVPRVWTFHEAADTANFFPKQRDKDIDVIWVGNWGDDERTAELQEFLIGPAARLKGRKVVHGVRYPEDARKKLADAGFEFRGYLPNLRAPDAYAESCLTLHIPRRQYTNGLSGIPTIRVFEAMACGIPLLCSPWTDTEGLFRPRQDYVSVPDGRAMLAEIQRLTSDTAARAQLAENGLQTIRARHTCAHRAAQLVEICQELGR
jgi:spore maturation protein CgeB